MSRSTKVKIPKFTDPKDVAYLKFFGASRRLLELEKAKVNYQSSMSEMVAMLPGMQDWAQKALPPGVPSGLAEVKRVAEVLGYHSDVKALPPSTGAEVFDVFLEKDREPEVVRR